MKLKREHPSSVFPVLQRVVGRVSSTVLVSVTEVRLKSCCNFLVGRRTFFFKEDSGNISSKLCDMGGSCSNDVLCDSASRDLCDVCCVAVFSS